MRIDAPAHSQPKLARALSRAKLCVLDWAAFVADALGAGPLAAWLRAMIVAKLRQLAFDVQDNLFHQAQCGLHYKTIWVRTMRPQSAAPGARVRLRPRGSARRVILHGVFARRGLSSRDPKALVAAILAAIADAPRLIRKMMQRLARGFKHNQLTLGHPPALTLVSDSPALAAAHADTS